MTSSNRKRWSGSLVRVPPGSEALAVEIGALSAIAVAIDREWSIARRHQVGFPSSAQRRTHEL